MILYLFGEDTFRSKQYLSESVEQFKKQRDPRGYNTTVLDGKKVQAGKLFSEINAAPFLAEKRLVVVENLLSSSDKEMLAEFHKRLEEKKFPEGTVLICWQGEALSKVKEAKELHGALQKEKYAREFSPLTGVKLSAWVQKEVELRGGKIDLEAVSELTKNVTDMWQLNTLLNQLVAYKNKETITLSDVGMFVEEKIDDNVFNLVDAVISGNHKTAFKLLSDQKKAGEDAVHLFGLLLWQFRVLLQISDFLEREPHTGSDEIANMLKIHPFVAKKSFAIAKRYSLSKLEAIYDRMLEMDLKMKTGQAEMAALLDLFVAKI